MRVFANELAAAMKKETVLLVLNILKHNSWKICGVSTVLLKQAFQQSKTRFYCGYFIKPQANLQSSSLRSWRNCICARSFGGKAA